MYLELLGMLICFGMVALIASQANQDDEKAAEEEGGTESKKFLGIMIVIGSAVM